MRSGSLLEAIAGLLTRTYRMRTGVTDLAPFVIGDEGYRRLYRDGAAEIGSPGVEARVLIRERDDGVRAAIYFPDEVIATLEAHPPQHGVGERNVDAFAVLVEELDHLLCVAERAADGRPVSRFELELHANVSKHLVLRRFLAGPADRPLAARRRAWLRWHLFHKRRYADPDPDVRARYEDAARWALRLIDALERTPVPARLPALRAFHRAGAADKLNLIGRLATA